MLTFLNTTFNLSFTLIGYLLFGLSILSFIVISYFTRKKETEQDNLAINAGENREIPTLNTNGFWILGFIFLFVVYAFFISSAMSSLSLGTLAKHQDRLVDKRTSQLHPHKNILATDVFKHKKTEESVKFLGLSNSDTYIVKYENNKYYVNQKDTKFVSNTKDEKLIGNLYKGSKGTPVETLEFFHVAQLEVPEELKDLEYKGRVVPDSLLENY